MQETAVALFGSDFILHPPELPVDRDEFWWMTATEVFGNYLYGVPETGSSESLIPIIFHNTYIDGGYEIVCVFVLHASGDYPNVA